MKSKFARGPALGFLLRFVVVFGLLIAPWKGWDPGYSRYFQSVFQMAFDATGENPRKVTLEPATGKNPGLDVRLTLQNTAQSGPTRLVETTELDSRSIGWVPTALTVALVLATPIPWRRHLGALAGGLVLIHLFIFFTLLSWVWNNSPSVSLLTLSGFWQRAVGELNYALMNQLGVSFSVPVLIWVIVTFRRQDQEALAA